MVSIGNEPRKRISIFLNKDMDSSCETIITSLTSYNELMSECKEKLNINPHKKCLLFDSKGAELSDDDIEYLNEDEPLFLSQGEQFSKSSNLLLYTEIKPLGSGGFGSVSLYEHKLSHKKVAIKKVALRTLISPEDINRVYNEIGALRELRHPNIVQLYQTINLQEDFCFVMEYCSGGELKEYIKKFGPMSGEKVYNVALQIVSGIRYCHNSGIVHRDLKLENILFSDSSYEVIKIVDFGISGMFQGKSGERSNCGSILYIPPEMYTMKSNQANPALDIWALGCIFYFLLTGTHPFMDTTRKDIIKKITKLNYQPLSRSIPLPWRKLVRNMLRLEPEKRWDMVRIQEHLEKFSDNPSSSISSDSDPEEQKSPQKPKTIQKNFSLLSVPKPTVYKSISPRNSGRLNDFGSLSRNIQSSTSLKSKK